MKAAPPLPCGTRINLATSFLSLSSLFYLFYLLPFSAFCRMGAGDVGGGKG